MMQAKCNFKLVIVRCWCKRWCKKMSVMTTINATVKIHGSQQPSMDTIFADQGICAIYICLMRRMLNRAVIYLNRENLSKSSIAAKKTYVSVY